MKYLIVPLVIMIGCAFFSVLLIYGTDIPISDVLVSDGDFYYDPVNGSVILNNTESEYSLEGYSYESSIDLDNGLLTVVGASVVVVVLAGVTVLSTGLDTFSVATIFKITFYYGVWLLLSNLGLKGLNLVPIFGWAIFFLISFVYMIGVMEQVGSL